MRLRHSAPITGLLALSAVAFGIGPAAAATAPEGFAVNCRLTRTASVDPIVMPGMTGMTHLHEFFGNVTTDQNSTGTTLLSGAGTCSDANDRSAYWVPALMVGGVRVAPQFARVYYIGGGPQVTAFPTGFTAVSGRSDQTAAWACVVPGQAPVFSSSIATVPTCAPGAQLLAQVIFPQCWDGVSLDSADHSSHLAFPANGGRGAACPADHPVRVPQVRLDVIYPPSVTGGPSVTLSSGAASTLHGDMLEAWAGTSLADRVAAPAPLGGGRTASTVAAPTTSRPRPAPPVGTAPAGRPAR